MHKIAMAPFASPIGKTGRLQVVNQIPDLSRHLRYYDTTMISSVKRRVAVRRECARRWDLERVMELVNLVYNVPEFLRG